MPQNIKKVPMRKCMGCNESKPKKELIRIVREPDGKITLDEKGKISGRGVYICPDKNCLVKVKRPDVSDAVWMWKFLNQSTKPWKRALTKWRHRLNRRCSLEQL